MNDTNMTESEIMKLYRDATAAADADAKDNGRFKIFPLSEQRVGLPLADLREWMQRNDDRLAHCVADVPDRWRKLSMPDMRFPGECFPRAIQFLQGFGPRNALEHRALYVFGEARCGGLGQHAWVEIEDRIVFDGVQQQFYAREGFYASEHARPWYRFTRPALVALWRRKHFRDNFRWECQLDLPWASDPKNPLTVTLEMVRDILGKRIRQGA